MTWLALFKNTFIKLFNGTSKSKCIIYGFMEHGLMENISVS